MISYVQKGISLILLSLITLLFFNYFKIIEFDATLKESFAFITVVLSSMSAIFVILDKVPKINKVINYTIIVCLIIGGLIFINTNEFNLFIFIFIFFTIVYSLLEVIYNK